MTVQYAYQGVQGYAGPDNLFRAEGGVLAPHSLVGFGGYCVQWTGSNGQFASNTDPVDPMGGGPLNGNTPPYTPPVVQALPVAGSYATVESDGSTAWALYFIAPVGMYVWCWT